MKKKVYSGVIGSLILGICFFLVGLFLGYISYETTYENLVKQGDVYQGWYQESNKEKELAAELIFISPKVNESDAVDYYIAVTNQEKAVIVDLPKGDTTFDTLHRDGNNMLVTPYLLVAKQEMFNDESQKDIKKYIKGSVFEEMGMDTKTILSVQSLKKSQFYHRLMSVGFAIFGLIIIGVAIKRYFTNKKSYQKLFDMYPELANDLSQMESQASYVDKKLGVVIYKDSILFTKGGVLFFAINQISWIGYGVTTIYRGLIQNKQYQINLLLKESAETSRLDYALQGGKYNKKKEAEIQEFFAFLATHYPQIKLGEQEKPQSVKESKMTIDEFLSQNKKNNQSSTKNVEATEENEQEVAKTEEMIETSMESNE